MSLSQEPTLQEPEPHLPTSVEAKARLSELEKALKGRNSAMPQNIAEALSVLMHRTIRPDNPAVIKISQHIRRPMSTLFEWLFKFATQLDNPMVRELVRKTMKNEETLSTAEPSWTAVDDIGDEVIQQIHDTMETEIRPPELTRLIRARLRKWLNLIPESGEVIGTQHIRDGLRYIAENPNVNLVAQGHSGTVARQRWGKGRIGR